MTKKPEAAVSEQEEEVIQRTSPPGEVVYKAISAEGKHELERTSAELALSGLAAGLSMGFSMVAEALLRAHLPEARWTPLVSKLGYAVGFLIVILGRQQLFTKNTLTVILPLLRERQPGMLAKVGQLWITVLTTNLIGTAIFAWLVTHSSAFSDEMQGIFLKIGQAAIAPGVSTLALRGIFDGWLIAIMVWLLPFAESARVWVIIILSYLVALAELPHIIAGSVETLCLVFTGSLPFGHWLFHFFLPTLLGNIIGGVALVAVGAHAEFVEADEGG